MLARLLSTDMPASSTITRERLGWTPTHPGLLEDIEQGHYFSSLAPHGKRDSKRLAEQRPGRALVLPSKAYHCSARPRRPANASAKVAPLSRPGPVWPLRAPVAFVEQSEDLPAGCAEVRVVAARVSKLGNAGTPHGLKSAGQVRRPELDPRAAQRVHVIDRAAERRLGCERTGFDAEGAAIGELDEQDGVREPERELDDLAPEDVAKQGRKRCTRLGLDEEMDPRSESADTTFFDRHPVPPIFPADEAKRWV
jgi:hypothetical protein